MAGLLDQKELSSETKEQRRLADIWQMQIESQDKKFRDFYSQGDKIVASYRDSGTKGRKIGRSSGARKFNILWSNISTIRPSTFRRIPEITVSRRHGDRDPVGRAASQILERTIEAIIDSEEWSFRDEITSVVNDRLLQGRGVSRIFYEADLEKDLPDDDDFDVDLLTEEEFDQIPEQVTDERINVKYWYWKDFLHGPARVWRDVTWVAFRSFMTKSEATKRFGKDFASRMNFSVGPDELKTESSHDHPAKSLLNQAVIWEIWDKDDLEVIWWSPGVDEILDREDDPLGLTGFFPCPKPLFATLTNEDLEPTPDFKIYEDQAAELNRTTARIYQLQNALRVVGFYPGADEATITSAFTHDNRLVPVLDWRNFAEKGGISNIIQWLPLDMIVVALRELFDVRDRIKQDLFEISGISDIVRGSTDPNETLGAQRLKGQFASTRLEDRRDGVNFYIRDQIRLIGEVAAEIFSEETLRDMSGWDSMKPADASGLDENDQRSQALQAVEQDPNIDQQQTQQIISQSHDELFDQAVKLLKSDGMRKFRLDIETETTVAFDEGEDRDQRIEFLSAIGRFLSEAVPVIERSPEMAPLLLELLHFTMRSFKVGREVEQVFEQVESNIKKSLQSRKQQEAQQQGQQTDPRIQIEQMRGELKKLEIQVEKEIAGQKLQSDQTIKSAELDIKKQDADTRRAKVSQDGRVAALKIQTDRDRL